MKVRECAPDADPNGDAMPNLFEYVADTNPTQANWEVRSQKSEVRSQRSKADGLRIEWQGGEQSRQFLERNNYVSLPSDRWAVIHTNNPPTPLQTNFFAILGTNRTLFYRVRAVRE